MNALLRFFKRFTYRFVRGFGRDRDAASLTGPSPLLSGVPVPPSAPERHGSSDILFLSTKIGREHTWNAMTTQFQVKLSSAFRFRFRFPTYDLDRKVGNIIRPFDHTQGYRAVLKRYRFKSC